MNISNKKNNPFDPIVPKKQNPFNPIKTSLSGNPYFPSMPYIEGGGANTIGGKIYNTVAGIPKATVGVVKDLLQRSATTVGNIGISAANQAVKNYNYTRQNPIFPGANPQKTPIPLPFQSVINTKGNPITNAVFGGRKIKTISELNKETSKTLKPFVGGKIANFSAFPLVSLGMYLDLAPFGGGSAVKTLDEIPEAFFKNMAKDNNPLSIESKLSQIGMDRTNSISLAGKFSQVKTAQEVKDVLGSHLENEALGISGDVSSSPIKNTPVDNSPSSVIPNEIAQRQQELEQRQILLDINKEAIDSKYSYLKPLLKYVQKRGDFKGQLPEVTGEVGRGLFRQKGDTFDVGGRDSETVRAEMSNYLDQRKNIKVEEESLKKDIKQNKIDIANIKSTPVNEIPTQNITPVKPIFESNQKPIVQNTISPYQRKRLFSKLPEYKISGDTLKERVRSAINNSESVRNDLRTRGQDALREAKGYGTFNRKLDTHDLNLVYRYEDGIPINELAKKAHNPAKFTKFMNKLVSYYNMRYLNDIAAGGETNYIPNYIVHNWDLSKPEDLKRFNKEVIQMGMKRWKGFRSQPRIFSTYKEGISKGFKPLNNNVLEDLKKDYIRASSVISKQVLKSGLKEAAPKKVSLSGYGITDKGVPFVNSNITSMQGLSYAPEIDNLLKGFESLSNKDIFKIAVRESEKGFTNTLKALPQTAKEAGFGNVLGSIYDNINRPLKHTILNLSGFHSINITASHLGASLFYHPLKGLKGTIISVPSFFSETFTNKVIDAFKNKMVKGKDMSIFEAGVRSGVNMDRGLPMKGHNPLHVLSNAIFNRELYTLKLNLVDQLFGSGKIDPNSVKGRAIGLQINEIIGEMNSRTENMNPNTQKVLSRILLAPGFTESKYATIFRAFTKNKKNAGNFARASVVGKSIIIGTLATLGTILATGKFPDVHQSLLNYTINPSSQTNIRSRRGRKKEITFPKTYIDEPLSLFQNPGAYFRNRFAPALTDIYEALPPSNIGTGKNYYGTPIVNLRLRQSPFMQKVTNISKSNLPIGIQHLLNYKSGKETGKEAVIGIFGLNSRINRTKRSLSKTNPFNPI